MCTASIANDAVHKVHRILRYSFRKVGHVRPHRCRNPHKSEVWQHPPRSRAMVCGTYGRAVEMKSVTIAVAAIAGLFAAVTTARTAESASSPANTPRVVGIGEMSVERAAHQATLLPNGQVLITGGCSGRGCERFHRSVEVYDPATRSFQPRAPMTIPRVSHTATLLPDGRVLVAGGCSGQRATASAETYDVKANRWTRVGDMMQARCSHIAVPLPDGRVFVVGGGGGRLGDLASAEVFDPATSTFASLGPMHSNHYLATRLADGRVLLTGGQGDGGEILKSAEIFDPETGHFQATGNMAIARVKHAAALLPDGRVLVIGGSDRRGYKERFGSTEVYDPQTGRFSPGPALRSRRHKFRDAVAVLPSGAVFVAGGAVRPEIYDPAEHKFVPVRGMLSGPQMFATATALQTGEVLILGGYDARTQPSAAAWLVVPAR